MRNLDRRLRALEGEKLGDLADLTDDELSARLVDVCEQIESLAGPRCHDWRDAIARQDWAAFLKMEIVGCEA